jgi:hypothetical protein
MDDGSSYVLPFFTHSFDSIGKFEVTLYAYDRNGCVDTFTQVIEVDYHFSLFVPTAFTPNQDGKNERFRITGVGMNPNAFRMWMFRFHDIRLKAASECGDMEEMLDYARHHTSGIGPIKIVITGSGRVGKGAVEVLKDLGIREVEPSDFISQTYEHPVFTLLSSRHYLKHKTHSDWDEHHFRQHPGDYESDFFRFAECTDLFIPCHFWDPKAPVLFSRSDAASDRFKIKVISDVTCDLDGSIPTTVRSSTIEDPFFDLDPLTWKERKAFSDNRNISICAVDNLPCELPFDASKAFGEMLEKHVIPELISGKHEAIERATIAKNGQLTPRFQYLSDYVYGQEEKISS